MSGSIIYGYVGGNPLSFTDPSGLIVGFLELLAKVGVKTVEIAKQCVAKKGWRVGDDIYATTKKGTDPAWSTVRSRFWKNEGATEGAAEKYGAENLDRIRAGKAPQRYNADKGGIESMELSHEPIPARDGGQNVVPKWPQDHAAVDPFRRPGY